MSHYMHPDCSFYFLSPIDGDCITPHDALPPRANESGISSRLTVPVLLKAPENSQITVNGRPALPGTDKTTYTAAVPLPPPLTLNGWRNILTATNHTTGESCSITLFCLNFPPKSFRLSSDDNILFLKDINDHKDSYHSIFDNPYLAVYREAHEKYSAKVHLNLFYEFDEERTRFSGTYDRFDLSMMTDKFKEEFTANADWLKLAFHAFAERPDRPYVDATPEQIAHDAALVNREILRFAGPASLPDTTTVHWGEATPDCVRTLRAMGYRALTGYFEHTPKGRPLVAYFYPDDIIDHVGKRDFWYDREMDMFYGRIDLVLNCNTHQENLATIKQIMADPHRGNFISIMIHEQYFYPDYIQHRPDFRERVLDVCRTLWEHGYRGCHISEAVREPHLRERL